MIAICGWRRRTVHFIQGTVHIFFSFQEGSWHKRQELTLGTIRLIEIHIFRQDCNGDRSFSTIIQACVDLGQELNSVSQFLHPKKEDDVPIGFW